MADMTVNFAGNKSGGDRMGSRDYNKNPVTKKEFQSAVAKADTNHDGTVTAEEVKQYQEKYRDQYGDPGIAVMNMLNKAMKDNKSDSMNPLNIAMLEFREFGPKLNPDPIILK